MKPLYTASTSGAWLFIKWCVVWVVVVVQRDGWSLKITNSLFRPFTQISRSQRLLPWEERRDLCWGYNCGSERAETKKGITNTKNNKLYNEKNDSVIQLFLAGFVWVAIQSYWICPLSLLVFICSANFAQVRYIPCTLLKCVRCVQSILNGNKV